MPILGQQYPNGFRPYSSFRVPRSSCSNNNNNNGQSLSSNGTHRATTATAKSTAATVAGKCNNTTSSSSCSSSTSLNQQQQQQQLGVVAGSSFSRQQPWRSSYCSSNRLPLQLQQQQQQRNVKPLTPKLIRRIESACATSSNCPASSSTTSSRYGKPRAPAPPPTLMSARKQNPPTPQAAKRSYQATSARYAKENCPTVARSTQRGSTKNYPAPLPPRKQQHPNDLKSTPKQQRAGATVVEVEAGGASSTGSSDSHDSPRLKKAYSKKFPQGLPFEEEFYGCRNRSYSQSSSNYSFYSSVGQDDEDEFQRKPATDEALYVDFSKVVHSHKQQRQYVPASSWIRATPEQDELPNPTLTPAQQRRKSGKYARSMHDYLYSDNTTTATTTTSKSKPTTTTKLRLPVLAEPEPEDGYYSYAAGTPEPQTPPTPPRHTDIYVAAASWAPKPLYPDRVLLPTSAAAADSNNNLQQATKQQQTRRRSEHLAGSTTCEYKWVP